MEHPVILVVGSVVGGGVAIAADLAWWQAGAISLIFCTIAELVVRRIGRGES
ncbi:hypothetical protein [Aeromicrobium sp. Leaf350]|uniref:hypothetical protein n=1 Tax=Aeromicrobium sp. Leaf350 TaxID=2876565 RepID=UPI001E5D72BD|nr:hypothetical protein [Aeromicrobium sp. Leaf350]